VLHAYETDPDVWRTRLLQVLASELELDEEILGAARAVLRADRRTGHVIVDVVGCCGTEQMMYADAACGVSEPWLRGHGQGPLGCFGETLLGDHV
jgi:hypothetical protein